MARDSAPASRSIRACLGISGMYGNEGYWGGGISIINQNFPKSPSILFHPLDSSISQTSPQGLIVAELELFELEHPRVRVRLVGARHGLPQRPARAVPNADREQAVGELPEDLAAGQRVVARPILLGRAAARASAAAPLSPARAGGGGGGGSSESS
jgi:hypothetical protein